MVVRRAEAARLVVVAVKEIRPPERAVGRDELRGRLTAAMRPGRQFTQLDPGAVFHRGITQIDLEPVPHDERRA